eukprot:Mrub_04006.p1 GENE.Mrub_04006~~Mrub_04006.p1  ORF type:complete len:447 (+),score=157.25 Mrub_04006:103-1341(+)
MQNKIEESGNKNQSIPDQITKITDIVMAEYVWLGGDNELRGKTKTIHNCSEIKSLGDLPSPWNFDGSSTKQATGDDSEVFLKPVKFISDPFRGAPHVLVMCETYSDLDLTIPGRTNLRHFAQKIFDASQDEDPWFGIEQEYVIMDLQTKNKQKNKQKIEEPWPLGFPRNGYPQPQGPYYCGVGGEHAFGRKFSEAVLFACLEAGLAVSGANAEVMCGQWEVQVGPCRGVDAADQLWLCRYIMQRLAEQFRVKVDLDPKPVKGDWNGSGCHTNFSCRSTRNDTACANIYKQLENLGNAGAKCTMFYGRKNYERLTGKHETSNIKDFTYGVADRGCSVRIPRTTDLEGRGYYEDRRPSSDIDPYPVTAAIFDAAVFGGSPRLDEMVSFAKENIPNLLLSEAKVDHYIKCFSEDV